MIADNMDTAYFLPQLIREEIYQFFKYINKKKLMRSGRMQLIIIIINCYKY